MTHIYPLPLMVDFLSISTFTHFEMFQLNGMRYCTTTAQDTVLRRHFTNHETCSQRRLFSLRHLPALSCQTCIIIHMTNSRLYLLHYSFIYNNNNNNKKFCASGKRKSFCNTAGLSLKCASFYSAYLIQYVVICIKISAAL